MEDIRFCPEHGYYRGDKCEICNFKGELVLEKERVEKLGRFVSGILRHFPERFRLKMDKNGWVDFDALSRVVSRKYKWANQWLIKAMIYSDRKNRYELSNNKIRARYGHSVDVELSDYEIADNDVLYYGTGEEEAHRLIEIGIKPVNQKFVHLSTSIEKGIEVAMLRTDDPIILIIDAKKAREEGIRFIKANEFIVLSEEVPPKYIKLLNQT
jgi:putative RNA 2'-phosphotransferase